jgi:hypothetical protein
MFVSTEDGEIPLNRVTRAIQRRDGVTLFYGDGEATKAEAAAWEVALRDTPLHTFPAEPDTYLLHAYVEEGRFYVSRSRVLAWSISADRILYPVTTEGVNGGLRDTPPVLLPDGQVEVYGDRTFDTYDVWAADAELRLCAKPQSLRRA